MKKVQFLIIAILVITLSACGGNYSKEDIMGTWQVTDFTTTAELSPVLIETTTEMVKTNVYIFKENSYNESSDYMGFTTESSGSWEADLEKKSFQLNMNDNGEVKVRAYVLEEFNGSKMVWQDDMGDMGVNRMTLEKK